MLITSSLSPASGQLGEDAVAFSYPNSDEVSCHFITNGNDFDYVVPESSHTVEIQYISEDADERKPFNFSSESEGKITDVDIDLKQTVEGTDGTVTDVSEDRSAKSNTKTDHSEINDSNTFKCSHLPEIECESSSEEDLTNLNWLQNITNIMSVPSLAVPPAAPKPVPKVHKSRLFKLNQTLSKCQEDFMTNLHNYQTKGDKRPPYSYNTLICLAMRYNNNKMTLSAIYSWIKENFRYFRNADPSWQNAIRHNLSLNEVFVKVARSKQERGKGGFWKLELARLQNCQVCRRGEPLKYQRNKRKAQPAQISPKKEKDADVVSKSSSSDLLLTNTVMANDIRQRSGIHDSFQDFSLGGFSFDANVVGANVVVEPALPPPLIPEEDLSGLLVVPCDWEDLQLEMLDSFIDSCFK